MATTQNRRYSFSSSTSSSLAKRQASSSETVGKAVAAKKRAPLGNITNQRNVSHSASKTSLSKNSMVSCSNKVVKAKKGPSSVVGPSSSALPALLNVKSNGVSLCKDNASLPRNDEAFTRFPSLPVPCSMDVSPSRSDGDSGSLDESMSTCDSFRSPEVEYIDRNDVQTVDSIERKTFTNLYISDHAEAADMEMDGKVVDLDTNYMDPQLCATIACDIYKHLRASEVKKRPSTDFMDKVQKDVNASMRAILVDWLVEVAEEYRLVPDTLYLTVNYIDRYLSGNVMNRQRLQLLGVACMMVASKYEEICAPQVEEFCYITDNTYFKDEVLEMESNVLNYLKFEMTAPTAKCFLRRFVRAAQGVDEVPSMQLECMANYIAELSLLEYDMLRYPPSLIAASAIFLAKFFLNPSNKPWNSTLQHYTLYRPSDMAKCVKDLHRLCCDSVDSSLPAIREKYRQHKYKYVAQKACPPLLPQGFLLNLS